MELRRNFSKSELKNGMIVETRKGTLLLVVNDTIVNNDCWVSLYRYNEDLTRFEHMGDNYRDIMKVYTTHEYQSLDDRFKYKKLIWERVDYKEMTLKEVEKELGYKIKIIPDDLSN